MHDVLRQPRDVRHLRICTFDGAEHRVIPPRAQRLHHEVPHAAIEGDGVQRPRCEPGQRIKPPLQICKRVRLTRHRIAQRDRAAAARQGLPPTLEKHPAF